MIEYTCEKPNQTKTPLTETHHWVYYFEEDLRFLSCSLFPSISLRLSVSHSLSLLPHVPTTRSFLTAGSKQPGQVTMTEAFEAKTNFSSFCVDLLRGRVPPCLPPATAHTRTQSMATLWKSVSESAARTWARLLLRPCPLHHEPVVNL